jgi:hypothetical protein
LLSAIQFKPTKAMNDEKNEKVAYPIPPFQLPVTLELVKQWDKDSVNETRIKEEIVEAFIKLVEQTKLIGRNAARVNIPYPERAIDYLVKAGYVAPMALRVVDDNGLTSLGCYGSHIAWSGKM